MSYEPKTYRKQGGDEFVVADGGKIDVEAGGSIQQNVVAAGATLTLTRAAHDGKVILLDTAAGSIVTLPAATGSGARYTFLVSVTVSSNAHIVKVADADTVMDGIILAADDTATPAALVWVTAATSDTVNLDGSTQGGLIGDRLELVDIAADQWAVHGIVKQSGTEATPFAATVA